MRGYLINSVTCTVTAVEVTTWRDICPLIGAGDSPFTVGFTFSNGDTVYVDDEGYCKPRDGKGYFCFMRSQPLCGNGLVLGTDTEGKMTSPRLALADIYARIFWLAKDVAEAQLRGQNAFTVSTLDEQGNQITLHAVLWDELLNQSEPANTKEP